MRYVLESVKKNNCGYDCVKLIGITQQKQIRPDGLAINFPSALGLIDIRNSAYTVTSPEFVGRSFQKNEIFFKKLRIKVNCQNANQPKCPGENEIKPWLYQRLANCRNFFELLERSALGGFS
jgi:hypothetical protein